MSILRLASLGPSGDIHVIMNALPASGTWHATADSLRFRPSGHEGFCFVHRLAFRTLIGRDSSPDECQAFFAREAPAFQAAAARKMAERGLPSDANFHLTSRDVLRAIGPGRQQTVVLA
jgi:hypothetical protein